MNLDCKESAFLQARDSVCRFVAARRNGPGSLSAGDAGGLPRYDASVRRNSETKSIEDSQDGVASVLLPGRLIVADRVGGADESDDLIHLGDHIRSAGTGRGLPQPPGERQEACRLVLRIGLLRALLHITHGKPGRKSGDLRPGGCLRRRSPGRA
jgi:hypothetical protein